MLINRVSVKVSRYDVQAIDKAYSCKQDVDPTDWLGMLAANMTAGAEEATPTSAGSVMAPNTDNGLFGNPEEYNKFTLALDGTLSSMPWGGPGPQGSGGNGYLPLWKLQEYSLCTISNPYVSLTSCSAA
jgi:hypothetical protein